MNNFVNRLVVAVAAVSMLAPTAVAQFTPESAVAITWSNVGGTDMLSSVHLDFDPYAGVGSIDGEGDNCAGLLFVGVPAKILNNWPAWIVQTASATVPVLPGTGSLAQDPTGCAGETLEPQHVQVGASTLYVENSHNADLNWANGGTAVRVGPNNDASEICVYRLAEPIALTATAPHGPAPLPNTIANHGGSGPCISITDDFDFDGEEPNTEPGRLASFFDGIPIAERYGNNFGFLEFCHQVWIVKDQANFEKLSDYSYVWYDGVGNGFAGAGRVAQLHWDWAADFGSGGKDQICV